MHVVNESGRGSKYIMKKSIFIPTIYKIADKEQAEQLIKKTKDEFKKASHNAFAYRVGNPIEWEESSDDGEVKGCAGVPLMNLLKAQELTNTLIIVTRFYGGINLGAGGLIRSYSKCASELIIAIGKYEL